MTSVRKDKKKEPQFVPVMEAIREMNAEQENPIRELGFAIHFLETSLDLIYKQLINSRDSSELRFLAAALASASRALFQGHRTLAALNGKTDPIRDAIEELRALDFDED